MAELLIVDDDLLFCEALSTTMREEGHTVFLAHTLEKARELLKTQIFSVAFIDVFLPDGNGLDLLAGFALLPAPPEAIVITAQGNPDGAEMAITSGAWDYIQKPAHMGQIALMVKRALQTHALKRKNLSMAGSTGIVGECIPMRLALLKMFEAAQSDTPVLVNGETGTGKELVAKAIHKNSRRAGGPFVVVDCGAITPTLLESELFGNVRGAFTGASQSRQGLVLLANGGTLFLDEVGELALEQQKVFLRLLQEYTFRPLGSTEEIQSNFRVIAATNRNLSDMVEAGTFRADLLFRLQGCVVEIPPVRKRGDDVYLLVDHALQRTMAKYALKPKAFSAEAYEAFTAYSWPGNVRELLYTVERAALASHDEHLILPQHLPTYLRAQAARTRLSEPLFPAIYTAASLNPSEAKPAMLQGKGQDTSAFLHKGSFAHLASTAQPETWKHFQEETLTMYKRQYLLQLLEWAQGNVPLAAATAGISRQRLYTLLKENGISRQWNDGEK